jgi:hypothetical protein
MICTLAVALKLVRHGMTNDISERSAISRQLALYPHTFDSRVADGWARLFTDDGIFEVRMPSADTPMFRIQGSEQLRAFCSNAPRLLHHITGLVFDELLTDSARTRAVVMGTWTSPVDGNPALYTHGTYEQNWLKVQGTWRLARQVFISNGYDKAAFQTQAPT